MRHRIQSFAWTTIVLLGLIGMLGSSASAAPGVPASHVETSFQAAPLTYEICDVLDANNDGIVQRDEEDGLYMDLPDLNGDGEAGGVQSDQDVAVEGCTAVLADGESVLDPSTDFTVEALIALLISILLAIFASL
jgi:hypothetical protein